MNVKRIFEEADRQGLTAYALAKKAGLVPATVGYWKAGRYKPGAESLAKIAAALNVKLSSFFEEEAK